MLRQFCRIMRRAPLLVLILFIWFVLTVLSLIGRGRAYKNYDTGHGRLPGLSIVMRGFHDHVLPWSKTPGTGVKEDAAGRADAAADTAADADLPEADATEAVNDSEAKEEKDTAAASGGVGLKGTKAEDNVTISSGDAAKLQEDVSLAVGTLKVPDFSSSKVVEAKDYGVANEGYLSPDDTVYNTDKEGLFAPNGTYYRLQEVDDSYFADALLIGDSRTVGLYEYGDMAEVTSFLARESTTIYRLFDDDEKMEYTPKGKEPTKRTLKDLLSSAKFRKIYISVGVNELGVPDTKDYYDEFRKVVTRINKMQPEAIIYIQAIMHVSKRMSSTDSVYNNRAIVQRNTAISTLANGRNIFYIDMNADLCDENGDLKDELSGDGIHLKASACSLWHDFLKKNAAVVPVSAPEKEAESGQS